jgi:hypothetical protein
MNPAIYKIHMVLLTVQDRVSIMRGLKKFDPSTGELRDEKNVMIGTGDVKATVVGSDSNNPIAPSQNPNSQ